MRQRSDIAFRPAMRSALALVILGWSSLSYAQQGYAQQESVAAPLVAADEACPVVERSVPAPIVVGLPDIASVFSAQQQSVVAVRTQSASIASRRRGERVGQGSGFIVDEEGLIVTNYHVVKGARAIEVMLSEGKRGHEATLIGFDEPTDLAILKIDTDKALRPVVFGSSSEAKVGEWVVAIGSPFGLEYSVTAGIVSAKSRRIGHGLYDDFLQTDASINPGNSGGPLFNLRGEVIGVNTAIIRDGQGIGFAVPIDLVASLLPQLIAQGRVVRGYIGANLQPLTGELLELLELPEEQEGVLVAALLEDGPAERSGLRIGDLITAVDGAPIRDVQTLLLKIASTAPGGELSVEALRGDSNVRLALSVVERPDSSQALEQRIAR